MIDSNLHTLVVKHTIDYTYIISEVSRILINLYIERNYQNILSTGKSEDEIAQISFDLNGRHESLKFNSTTKQLINFPELNEMFTEMLVLSLIN